jgi:hypothetical protein
MTAFTGDHSYKDSIRHAPPHLAQPASWHELRSERTNATGFIQHLPEPCIQVASPPRSHDLLQSTRANCIRFFFRLLRGKIGTAERIDGMDGAAIVLQKAAGAIWSSRGHDCRNGKTFTFRDYDGARTRKEIFEREPHYIAFPKWSAMR